MLAEDCQIVAFEGLPGNVSWLSPEQAEALLQLEPDANVPASIASNFLRQVTTGFASVQPQLEEFAVRRGEQILDAHRRVRSAARLKHVTYRVEAQLPPDVLGIYVYLPKV